MSSINFTPTVVTNPSKGVQGVYPLTQTLGQEGAIADMQAYVTRSYRNQSGAVIPFGVFVVPDKDPVTNDVFAVKTASGATGILGLANEVKIFEVAKGGTYDTGATAPDGRIGYPDKQTITVLSKGVVWVYSAEAVDLGDAVRFFAVDHSATLAGSFQGRFGKTAVNNKTVALTVGARWLSKTSGAGLALLELDIPATTFVADTSN
jgi:hypothetical protein